MSDSALADARELLSVAGYGDDHIDCDYPVWLGPDSGVTRADLVAFGRPAPQDMSTAVIAAGRDSVEALYRIAQVIAAPYFLAAHESHIDLWVAEPTRPVKWRESISAADIQELNPWLQPSAALRAKIGLRQIPLFDLPVDLLATARSDSADRLGPLVADALQAASESLPNPPLNGETSGRRRHRAAARLVVGALTALVIRDRDSDRNTNRTLGTEALIGRVVDQHSKTFGWWGASSANERSVLAALIDQLGRHVDYQSLDPTILSQVYEEALVSEDDRQRLGIHYTPPTLARRLLADLPVETVPPDDRHVLDPCCGSGTLLVAAHDRLRDLQPDGLTESDSHHDLAVHLHGYDADPFAAEIARLTLLLHAQPAGNGWQIEEADTLELPSPAPAPKVIVTNPPWRFESRDQRSQAADAFLRWSMQALEPGGLLGILLPTSWLSAANSAATRRELMESFDVFETWRLPEGTFSTSAIATAVLLARKNDGLGGRGARVVREVSRRGLDSFLKGESGGNTFWVSERDRDLAETAHHPLPATATQPLADVAEILSGPQPLTTIANRGHGTLFLNHMSDVPLYSSVDIATLWRVAFPEDFQTARGERIIDKKKVLASAARSANSPWRFRVALDTLGAAMRNSMRGIAPTDQTDDDLLYALLIIVGSAYASSHAAAFGGDRNLVADVLKTLPIPTERTTLKELGDMGRKATSLAGDPAALSAHLVRAEQAVWDSYGIAEADRTPAIARFAGHPAPEGSPRYPAPPSQEERVASTFRHVGTVLDIAMDGLTVWVNGLTPDEGVKIPYPPRMPGWLVRTGATFDLTGVETQDDLSAGRYRFQPMAWHDLDLDNEPTAPIGRE